MSEQADICSDQPKLKQQEHREFRSDFRGIGLALSLAVVPLALVYWIGTPRVSLPNVDCSDELELKQQEHREFRSYFWGIGLALLLAVVPLALAHWIGMPRVSMPIVRCSDQPELEQQERREFRSYIWGVGLALLLTVVPFALVHWAGMPRVPLLIVIGAFALVQMLVHFRCFLHIGFRQKREDLQLILFTALLLTMMVAGTIWIMASLALRMTMPASP